MKIFDFLRNKRTNNRTLRSRTSDKNYFNVENLKNVQDYYSTTIILSGRKIELDLNFETKEASTTELDKINLFIDWLEAQDKQNKLYAKVDFNNEMSMTSDYLEFYLEELDDTELSQIIDLENNSITRIQQLFEKLNLIRVGIYPNASYFATFDYSIEIDGEPCNQLLVINVDKNGELDHITWES